MQKTEIREKIRQAAILREEPDWLLELRMDALEVLSELEDFGTIFEEEVEFSGNVPPLVMTDTSPRLAQVGSHNVYEQLPIELVNQGVIFTNFLTAVKEHEELVKGYWQKKAKFFEGSPVLARQVALMDSGVFLYLPKNVEIAIPFEYFWVQPEKSVSSVVSSTLILAEENAKCTFLEYLQSPAPSEEKAELNLFTEIITKAGASVRFLSNEALGGTTAANILHSGKLYRDSSVQCQINALSNGTVSSETRLELVGAGASAVVNIVAVASGKQEQTRTTHLKNNVGNSSAKIFAHGVALDGGKLSLTGIGEICSGASDAVAEQESRVLSLSDHSQVRVDPILLIDEEKVSAGHSASIGRIDEDALYYLMSRGMERKQAEILLIRGFLHSAFSFRKEARLLGEFSEFLEKKLERKLNDII